MEHGEATILVTGATGRQGGAVARHLLDDGWLVRVLVRDPSAANAQALRTAGVELAPGDLLDQASLDEAIAGAYGVYSMQPVGGAFGDVEETEARNLAEAARAAGVSHFVQSSVFGADRDSDVPWITPKHLIEQLLRESGLPVTVWRPVTFMEGYLRHRDEILGGRLRGPESPDDEKQLIAVDDIGKFVALSFREPEEWIGKSTDIAGDRMTAADIAEVFTSVLDLPVVYEQAPPPDGVPAPDRPKLALVDIAALRRHVPDLTTLEQWVAATGWKA